VTGNKKPRTEPGLKCHLPEGNIRPAKAEAGRGRLKLHDFACLVTRSFGRRTNRPGDNVPLDFAGSVQHVDPVGEMRRVFIAAD
jgi:hypothetical protein